MIIYGFPYSHNTRKVLACAQALDIAVELKVVNLLAKESFTPQFKALNPNGLTPVLQDGDFLLWESAAIMQYLAAQKPGNRIYPSGARQRALVDQWLFWNARHWDPPLDTMLIERMIKPLEGKAGDETVALAAEADGRARAAVLNAHLDGRDFLTECGFSLADIALASLLGYHHLCPLPIDDSPHILAWYDRIRQLDCWRATEPDWSALA